MSQGPSDSGQFQRVMEILATALELPAADRGRYLDEACGDQAALRAEVESLLASSSASVVIDRPLAELSIVGDVTNSNPAPETSLQPGQALNSGPRAILTTLPWNTLMAKPWPRLSNVRKLPAMFCSDTPARLPAALLLLTPVASFTET